MNVETAAKLEARGLAYQARRAAIPRSHAARHDPALARRASHILGPRGICGVCEGHGSRLKGADAALLTTSVPPHAGALLKAGGAHVAVGQQHRAAEHCECGRQSESGAARRAGAAGGRTESVLPRFGVRA
eukprot:4146662-Prymnesium_polylepis.1